MIECKYPRGDVRRLLVVLAAVDALGDDATIVQISGTTGVNKGQIATVIDQSREQLGMHIDKAGPVYRIRRARAKFSCELLSGVQHWYHAVHRDVTRGSRHALLPVQVSPVRPPRGRETGPLAAHLTHPPSHEEGSMHSFFQKEKKMFLQKVHVKKDQRALLFIKGNFSEVLPAGDHWLLDLFGVSRLSASGWRCRPT